MLIQHNVHIISKYSRPVLVCVFVCTEGCVNVFFLDGIYISDANYSVVNVRKKCNANFS